MSQKTKFKKEKSQIEIEKIKNNCEELISKHRYNYYNLISKHRCNKYNQKTKF